VVQTGSIIPALSITAMDSDLPGAITAQVSQNVYDSPTGQYLLIPQGARLYGEYASGKGVGYGQSRLFVAWQRIIFPDGTTLDIGAMPGADGQGMAGLRDLADSHWLRTFGSALLMSAIIAGTSLSQPHYSGYGTSQNAGSVLSEALGQSLGTAMSQLLEKNLNVAPTLKIRAGFRFNVMAVKDLVFTQPYRVPAY
jgi:type IV secretion system protein VirB10